MTHHKTGVRYSTENYEGESVTRVATFESKSDAEEFAEWWEDEHDRSTTVFTTSKTVDS